MAIAKLNEKEKQFIRTIKSYYRAHGRTLPWRRTRDPYRILVSEIMLQQTQVARVAPFYEKFIKQFPDFGALARAKTPDVLRVWQGLGYNRRALALQKLAQEIIKNHRGRLPKSSEELIRLPGIGPYTAGAIRAFAFNEPEIFIETNIRRVFIHFFFPARANVTDFAIRRYIERTLDRKNPREWYWALMDYGSTLDTGENPNRRSAHYVRQSQFTGSDREIRGKIIRELLGKRKVSVLEFGRALAEPPIRIRSIVQGLAKEGFLKKQGRYIQLAD